MRRRYWLLPALVALVAIGFAVWSFGRTAPDPRVARIQEIQARIGQPDDGMPPEKRAELLDRMRAEVGHLPEDQRREVMAAGRQQFQRHIEQRVQEYFALPPAERPAALDKELDRMQQFRQAMQARGAGGEPAGAPESGPAPTGPDNRPPGGAGQPAGPGFAGPPGPPNLKDMLNATTPEMRANMVAFMDAMRIRARERGITLPGPAGP